MLTKGPFLTIIFKLQLFKIVKANILLKIFILLLTENRNCLVYNITFV